MIPWYMQLIVGLIGVGGLSAGALYAVWKFDRRSHGANCKCNDCAFRRRVRALHKDAQEKKAAIVAQEKARKSNSDGEYFKAPGPNDIDGSHMTTSLLEEGMIVGYKGERYLVKTKTIYYNTEMYELTLQNMQTRNEFMTSIAFSMANLRIWKRHGQFKPLKPACQTIGHSWRGRYCERPGCHATSGVGLYKCIWCPFATDSEKNLPIHVNVTHARKR